MAKVVPALEDHHTNRLSFQSAWSDIAREDSKSGGAYTLFSVGAFVVQQSIPLLWASHILLTESPNDDEALNASNLARSLCENVVANAKGVASHGGKMSHAEGTQWAALHFPLVTTSPLFSATISRASAVGGMPKDWMGFVQ